MVGQLSIHTCTQPGESGGEGGGGGGGGGGTRTQLGGTPCVPGGQSAGGGGGGGGGALPTKAHDKFGQGGLDVAGWKSLSVAAGQVSFAAVVRYQVSPAGA